MYLFEASIPNTLRDSSSYLKNEVMASVDDYMEERSKGGEDTSNEEEDGYDYEDGYEEGYEDGYNKAKVESLAILGYLTISCISLFIIHWRKSN